MASHTGERATPSTAYDTSRLNLYPETRKSTPGWAQTSGTRARGGSPYREPC